MRIVHTSDWHLGRLFFGVHLTDDQAFALDQLLELLDDVRPDLVLVTGDIYDRAVPPPEAVALLDDVLSRIVLDLRLPTLMIAGNHDSPDRLGFASRLLAGQRLHLVSTLSDQVPLVTFDDEHGPVDFYPIPYVEPALVRQRLGRPSIQDHDAAMCALLERVHPMRLNSRRSVLAAHLLVTGGRVSDSERPLSLRSTGAVEARRFQGFRHVALGHLHRPQAIGAPHIRYAGSLLKYSFAEVDDVKSVDLIEIDAEGHSRVETIPLRPRRDVRRLEGYIDELVRAERDPAGEQDYLKVTLLDEGPILDAMGRLREIYPNTLQVDRPALRPQPDTAAPRDHRRLTETEIFAAFFEQTTGEALSEAQAAACAEVIAEVRLTERESLPAGGER